MSSMAQTPSFEEMETKIQDELISVITKSISHPRIRFWTPEERIADSEIEKNFKIYNAFIYITYRSKGKKEPEIKISIGINFGEKIITPKIPRESISALTFFSRSAARVLSHHFLDKESLYLGKARFDFITKDEESFIIPNIALSENIFLYNSVIHANSSHNFDEEADINRIPSNKYVEDKIEDLKALNSFYSQIISSTKKEQA